MAIKISSYHTWCDEPAVIVDNGDKTHTGYYWRGWRWQKANAIEAGYFWGKYDDMDDRQIPKEEFIERFGKIRLMLLGITHYNKGIEK